jgi:hypothetical protein
MSLRDWFRRHGNVFSISTKEVDARAGDEDMLREEYGARAVEAEKAPGYGVKSGIDTPFVVTQIDVSDDEIADAVEPPPESTS